MNKSIIQRMVVGILSTYIVSSSCLLSGTVNSDTTEEYVKEQSIEYTMEYVNELLSSTKEAISKSEETFKEFQNVIDDMNAFAEEKKKEKLDNYLKNEESVYHIKNQKTSFDLDFTTIPVVGVTTWGAPIYTTGAIREAGVDNETFIKEIAPIAQLANYLYNIPASTILAQIILESGWGKKILGNNIMGIKTTSSNLGPVVKSDTIEYTLETGDSYQIEGLFRGFNSIADCISYYCENVILANTDLYSGVVTTDWYASIYGLSSYATDPDYFNLLISVIQDNNLTQYNIY